MFKVHNFKAECTITGVSDTDQYNVYDAYVDGRAARLLMDLDTANYFKRHGDGAKSTVWFSVRGKGKKARMLIAAVQTADGEFHQTKGSFVDHIIGLVFVPGMVGIAGLVVGFLIAMGWASLTNTTSGSVTFIFATSLLFGALGFVWMLSRWMSMTNARYTCKTFKEGNPADYTLGKFGR